MNITITINNASYEVLAAISRSLAEKAAPHQPAVQDIGLTPAQVEAAQYDPQGTALRIASVADIDNYLDVGTEVHWQGQKYAFDGVVERISDDVFDTEGDLQYDVKAIFIRRSDTDKLVSLTLRDLQVGRLTLID